MSSLLAHDNYSQISINVNPFESAASSVKFDHQSHLYAPNGDVLLLHLSHSPHLKFFKNEVGLGYRKIFPAFGMGLNFYYMNMTKPGVFIHQLSPGIEVFYNNFQFSYNTYLPTQMKKSFKKGTLYHSLVSELGINYKPTKDLMLGLLPFFDHSKKEWGLNSKVTYTIKDKFEFAVSPYLKKSGNGCLFSFGINFGGEKTRANQSIHRSNDFSYLIEKRIPKIYTLELKPAYAPAPIIMPAIQPVILPPIEQEEESLPKETIEEKSNSAKPVVEPIKIEVPPEKPYSWWDNIPFFNYKGIGIAQESLQQPIRIVEPLSESSSFEMLSSASRESSSSSWEYMNSGSSDLSSSSGDEFYEVPFPSNKFYEPETWEPYQPPEHHASSSFNGGNELHIWEDYVDAKDVLNL
jgi:hypothetical protein